MRLVTVWACVQEARAQNATWLPTPGTGDFNNGANWNTGMVPTGTAAFDTSTKTNITFSAGDTGTFVDALQFNPGAPAYSFNVTSSSFLEISGTGIVNNSSNLPTLVNTGPVPPNSANGGTFFLSGATAGNAVIPVYGGCWRNPGSERVQQHDRFTGWQRLGD